VSQSGPLSSSGTSGGAVVETLTGNSGGPVGPDGSFNIDVVGNNATGIDVVGTPAMNLLTIIGLQASTTQMGVVELADNAETIAGTDTDRAVTPDDLKAKLGVQTAFGLPIGAGDSSVIAWTAAPTDGQLLIGSTGLTPVLNTLTAGAGISIANGPGTITISDIGGSNLTYTNVNTSPYVVLPGDQYLGVDCSVIPITLQFPDAPSTGRVFVVKDFGGFAATNNITITSVGGAIGFDGALTYTMILNFQSLSLLFDGTNYQVY
jgi:hypothetical protein